MICSQEGCGTRLSAYRSGDRCSIHAHPSQSYTAFLPSWAPRAACASGGQLLEDFFSEETSGGEATEQVFRAKRMCAGCPVRTECLAWALQHEDRETRAGIYGGLLPEERQDLDMADPISAGARLFDEQVTMYPNLRRRNDGRPRRSARTGS